MMVYTMIILTSGDIVTDISLIKVYVQGIPRMSKIQLRRILGSVFILLFKLCAIKRFYKHYHCHCHLCT